MSQTNPPDPVSTHDSYAEIANRATKLTAKEAVWREKQPFLEQQGYMLRPRYRPGWIPSWKDDNSRVYTADDGIFLPVSSLLACSEKSCCIR